MMIDAEMADEALPKDLTEEGVLVFGTGGADSNVAAETSVQATGRLMEFDVVEVEEELGTELDDAVFEEWEGEPALIARQIQ